MKLEDDKYYTTKIVAENCIRALLSVIDKSSITEVIEPSIGLGAFNTNLLKVDVGIDIDPKVDDISCKIIKTDYLSYNVPYKRGRLIIGNPPYGRCLNLAQKFYEKSVEIADYIAFILPISQLNNTSSFYKFDLILSIDLGNVIYTDRELHCCFNVYKRPIDGINKRKNISSSIINIIRQDSKNYEDAPYDIRMCYWGNGCAGKILKDDEHYSAEYKIQILDDRYKDKIINVLKSFDWESYLNCIAMRKIQQFHIIDVLKKEIDGFDLNDTIQNDDKVDLF